MKRFISVISVFLLLAVILLDIAGCSSSISQAEYDGVRNELNNVKAQVSALQDELDAASTFKIQYDQLNIQHLELKTQYDAQTAEIQTIQSDFNNLSASYEARLDEIEGLQSDYDELDQAFEELQAQYDALIEGQTVFTETEIDQAIFELINQERLANGLAVLDWGVNLHGWAKQNSISMSETGEFKYTSWLSTQAVLITSGQETFDGLVNGVMAVWLQQKHQFAPKFLSNVTTYGAVATYRSGDVFYITFLANVDP